MPQSEPNKDKAEIHPDQEKKQSKVKRYLRGWMRDILVSFAAVGAILVILYAYSGLWPFLVVVESGSMQHGSDSQIGVIDTGDMVIVKKLGSGGEITTYIQGKISGYSTYGAYGDVIVYRKNGHDDATPVIHRVVLFLRYNSSSNAFDIPELNSPSLVPNKDWGIVGTSPRWYAVTGKLWIADYGHAKINLTINLGGILSNVASRHDGYITLGDNNRGAVDQTNLLYRDELVQPVKFEWIVGVARGELPWFGALKLLFTGNAQYVPANSWLYLQISIALIILVPFLVDYWLEKRAKRKRKGETRAVVVCPSCKTENDLKTKKCVKCGEKLK
ncbi:MAG: S26 family signal peptidase [Thermoplasmata archaeon]|nr:S26 family signal peptidase [Thermoplasmata archaeon]